MVVRQGFFSAGWISTELVCWTASYIQPEPGRDKRHSVHIRASNQTVAGGNSLSKATSQYLKPCLGPQPTPWWRWRRGVRGSGWSGSPTRRLPSWGRSPPTTTCTGRCWSRTRIPLWKLGEGREAWQQWGRQVRLRSVSEKLDCDGNSGQLKVKAKLDWSTSDRSSDKMSKRPQRTTEKRKKNPHLKTEYKYMSLLSYKSFKIKTKS